MPQFYVLPFLFLGQIMKQADNRSWNGSVKLAKNVNGHIILSAQTSSKILRDEIWKYLWMYGSGKCASVLWWVLATGWKHRLDKFTASLTMSHCLKFDHKIIGHCRRINKSSSFKDKSKTATHCQVNDHFLLNHVAKINIYITDKYIWM